MNAAAPRTAVAALAGRRIDAGPNDFRFPLKQLPSVRQEIAALLEGYPIRTLVSSAACGADLLALVEAERLNIPCHIILPYEPAAFKESSVIDRPGDWADTFDLVVARANQRGMLTVLGADLGDPDVYLRVNETIVSVARSINGDEHVAILVWEGYSRGSDDLTLHFRTLATQASMSMLQVLTQGLVEQAGAYLNGHGFEFASLDRLWRGLRSIHEMSLARSVLAQLREQLGTGSRKNELPDGADLASIDKALCREEALLTSKDPELSAASRHDRALEILAGRFSIDGPNVASNDTETLGIAGGILKRRWMDLGRVRDLRRAADYYRLAAAGPLGSDAYAQINAAYLSDRLAAVGENFAQNTVIARALRERIANDLKGDGTWWNAASRAEALLGLSRFDEATHEIQRCTERPELWELQTTSRQLANIAHLVVDDPVTHPGIQRLFNALLFGARDAVLSAIAGKVGLALSGGGLRASFFHLGVLARLAELDVLRHIEVLSCVSGGSIVGAYYWLALRRRMRLPTPMTHGDFIALVRDVIEGFVAAASCDIRNTIRPLLVGVLWKGISGKKGVLDPERAAVEMQRHLFAPLLEPGNGGAMHELPFTPGDHNVALSGTTRFDAAKHNWLRASKVPELVVNATTMNTGHAWQFTPERMGESPWAIHSAADSIDRLDWEKYRPASGWTIALSRAVAASAAVPFLFSPLGLGELYPKVNVTLVDGGVHDNQGTASLLAQDCTVVLVSDACGQLLFEPESSEGVKGQFKHAMRTVDTLMERVRIASFSDLAAREQSGALSGFMFLHLKAGLSGGILSPNFATPQVAPNPAFLSPHGIRRDFQKALAQLRTDLDAFSENESNALMACGYQMTGYYLTGPLAKLCRAKPSTSNGRWIFSEMLDVMAGSSSADGAQILEELQGGQDRRLFSVRALRRKLAALTATLRFRIGKNLP